MRIKNYIDRVYYIIFGVYFLLCLEMVLLILLLKANLLYFVLGWVLLGVVLLIGYFFYSRYYNFNDDSVIIKVGFITKKIPYTSIENCYITHNYRLSYATSMKRIGLTLKERKNDIYISPEQMDEMLILLRRSTDTKEKVVKHAHKAPVKKATTKEVKKDTKKSTTSKSTTAKKTTKTTTKKTNAKNKPKTSKGNK